MILQRVIEGSHNLFLEKETGNSLVVTSKRPVILTIVLMIQRKIASATLSHKILNYIHLTVKIKSKHEATNQH
jgi:hypothetical protein